MEVKIDQKKVKRGYLMIRIGIALLILIIPLYGVIAAYTPFSGWYGVIFSFGIGWFILQRGRAFIESECPKCKTYNKWNAKKCKSCTVDLEPIFG